jgi:hypothetical protein
VLDGFSGRVSTPNLVICDGISQFFDEPIQDVGVVNILEELHQPVLVIKRFKLFDNSSQPPAENGEISNIPAFHEGGSTNLLRTSLRALSSLSWLPTWYASTSQSERTLSSTSLI